MAQKISIVYPSKEGIPLKLSNVIGERLRAYRTQQGLSQEQLAERAGKHTTYIGQLERGEKNATIETISKVASALGVPLSKLFENISLEDEREVDIPSQCYRLIQMQPAKDQKELLAILTKMIDYKYK